MFVPGKDNSLVMRYSLTSENPKKRIVLKDNVNDITGKELIQLGVDLPNMFCHTVCFKINIFPNSEGIKAGNVRVVAEIPLLVCHFKNGISREDKVSKNALILIQNFFVTRIRALSTKFHSSTLFFEKYVPIEIKMKQMSIKKNPITNKHKHSQLTLTLSDDAINNEIEKLEKLNQDSKFSAEAEKLKMNLE